MNPWIALAAMAAVIFGALAWQRAHDRRRRQLRDPLPALGRVVAHVHTNRPHDTPIPTAGVSSAGPRHHPDRGPASFPDPDEAA